MRNPSADRDTKLQSLQMTTVPERERERESERARQRDRDRPGLGPSANSLLEEMEVPELSFSSTSEAVLLYVFQSAATPDRTLYTRAHEYAAALEQTTTMASGMGSLVGAQERSTITPLFISQSSELWSVSGITHTALFRPGGTLSRSRCRSDKKVERDASAVAL